MYTGFSNGIGKNQMITSPTISMTQSIVDNAINNIDFGSTELFKYDEEHNAVETADGVPLEASLFKISGTDIQIDEDETNAVNKRFLKNKVDELDLKFETISDHEADMATVYDKTTVDGKLDLKANSADVYDKTTTDTLLSTKANSSNVYDKTESDNRYINVDEPVEKLGKVSSTTLTSISSFLVSATTQLSSVLATFTAESSSVDFDYRNIAAWTHETRYPSDMSTVAFKLVFKITGKSDQTFDCTVSNYYSGILNDQTYSNVPCDKFFDIFCNGTISCDNGDVVNVYMSFIDTSVSDNTDVASFEPEQSGHIRYFKATTTTSIGEYYNKSESDARYLGINDTASKAGQIEYTYNNTTYALKPNGANIGFYNGNTEKIRFFAANGIIGCYDVRPNNIVFGTTSFGQDTKWSGTIANIVNNANKSTADSQTDADKDTYVPSYRVLNDNYAPKPTVLINETSDKASTWTFDTKKIYRYVTFSDVDFTKSYLYNFSFGRFFSFKSDLSISYARLTVTVSIGSSSSSYLDNPKVVTNNCWFGSNHIRTSCDFQYVSPIVSSYNTLQFLINLEVDVALPTFNTSSVNTYPSLIITRQAI